MKKFLALIMILNFAAVLCLTTCDQEHGDSISSDTSSGSETADITTLEVIADVTIDTKKVPSLEGKTIDDIAFARLYYGFGTYTLGETMFTNNDSFKINKNDMIITPKGDSQTQATVKFTIKDNKLAGDFTPYFMLIFFSTEGQLGNQKTVHQETNVYEQNSVHRIRLSVDSVYTDQGILFGQ